MRQGKTVIMLMALTMVLLSGCNGTEAVHSVANSIQSSESTLMSSNGMSSVQSAVSLAQSVGIDTGSVYDPVFDAVKIEKN